MQIIHTITELNQSLANQKNIGLVPTMGNLHAGHIRLATTAKEQSDCVVVSIFVNPLQFGANEDLASYPRTLDVDSKKLETAGVDIVFAPSEGELYPTPQTMTIAPPPIAYELCGASRSGHFSGVATVVLKLFNIVRPNIAVFGKKDFQQLFIIRQLVSQFNLPIEIIAGDTMREEDGLAMSSRNGYLNAAERLEAQRLYRALSLVVDAAKKKKLDLREIELQTTQYLTQLGWIVDYISIRSAKTLLPPAADDQNLVALGAARLGKTRLIDNIEFDLVS
jgi:pantoate--beta-alanine ligase